MVLQIYFTYFELSQSLGWAKSKDHCEKQTKTTTPDHLQLVSASCLAADLKVSCQPVGRRPRLDFILMFSKGKKK